MTQSLRYQASLAESAPAASSGFFCCFFRRFGVLDNSCLWFGWCRSSFANDGTIRGVFESNRFDGEPPLMHRTHRLTQMCQRNPYRSGAPWPGTWFDACANGNRAWMKGSHGRQQRLSHLAADCFYCHIAAIILTTATCSALRTQGPAEFSKRMSLDGWSF